MSQPLNIIEFIMHPALLNDQSQSVAQQAFLKATYGLPLNSEEQVIYQRATGRSEIVPAEQNEVTLIAGRQGGKTKSAAQIAIYEAFRDHHLARGDRASIVLVAPAKYQAEIAMRYIRGYLKSSPPLKRHVASERRHEVELTNGI